MNVTPPPKIKGLPSKELLLPIEVAEYFSVTTRTIYDWCKSGRLESVKIGGTIRVKRESVLVK